VLWELFAQVLLEVPVGKSSKETKELQVACPVVCVADDKDSWHFSEGWADRSRVCAG
jgi:hypothetical protein